MSFDAGGEHPIDGPLWFVRDMMVMMVMMVISPLVLFVIKKIKNFTLPLLVLVWVADLW